MLQPKWRPFAIATILVPHLIAGGAPAAAQTGGNAAAIAHFAADPDHQKTVRKTAIDGFNTLWQCDHADAVIDGAPVAFPELGPLGFDAGGALSEGILDESVIVTGCNLRKRENVLSWARNHELQVILGMPGTTRANPLQIENAYPYATASAKAQAGSCHTNRFIDTRFDDFDGPDTPQGRPWHETWTAQGCGNTNQIVVYFTPDANGTDISVQMK